MTESKLNEAMHHVVANFPAQGLIRDREIRESKSQSVLMHGQLFSLLPMLFAPPMEVFSGLPPLRSLWLLRWAQVRLVRVFHICIGTFRTTPVPWRYALASTAVLPV